MPFLTHLRLAALALIAVLALAACDSAEERAEAHFQSGLALIAKGDLDRAIVELRSVFQLNGRHQEARRTLAELMLERGNRQEAYSQYLRLAEQYPDDLEARISLTSIAFDAGNWDEVTRHGAKASELAPDDPRVKAIATALRYGEAAQADDVVTRRDAARAAEALLADQPENLILRNLLIDAYLRDLDYGRALAAIDEMIARTPDNERLYRQRLAVLAQTGDSEALEAGLYGIVELFPGDVTHKQTLIRYLLDNGALDKAEDFLRRLASEAPAEEAGPTVDLIRFMAEIRGTDAARAEIETAIATHANPVPFRVLRAGLDFAEGQQDKAVAELEAVLEGAEPSEQTNTIRVTLARMLLATGNEVGARTRIEEVLAEDAGNPEALKMQAGWHVQADDIDAAIAALRGALDRTPEDAQALTLMAEAHTRTGSADLSRDYLALAVEASGNAPADSIRYARLLMREERYLPAEDILISSLRLNRNNLELLVTLGQLYLAMDDNGRTQDVVRTLRALDTEAAEQAANGLEAERLNRQGGTAEALAFLEGLAGAADAGLTTQITLIRARLATGDAPGALALAEEMARANPDSDPAAFVLAVTRVQTGDFDGAETIFRTLLAANPAQPPVWLELTRLKLRQGDRDGARAAMEDGLAATPDDGNLLWAKATILEQDGDIDGAIAVYETLYTQNSSSPVAANNLASLISTYRTDAESLERAWRIARRFRDTEIPALQDTYGWIVFRRGEAGEALPYLEAAAAGLPNDPVVQYHLGLAYRATERPADALAQMQRAVEIAGSSDLRPQIEEARGLIVTLREEAEAASGQ